MLIYFRLSSEHAGAYRECPIATSTITVGELKQLLARRCGFAAEFKRKIDFKVFLVSNNASRTKTDQIENDGAEDLVEVDNEEQQVQSFSRVVLQRTVVRGQTCQDVLQHSARTQLTADEWASAEGRQGHGKKRRLPPEWICGICRGLMRQPLLVKCASNCGHSACRSCIEAKLKQQHACPFCRSPFRQVIRNKRLEEILKNVNPDEYEQPVGGGLGTHSGDPSRANTSTPSGAPQADLKPHLGALVPNAGIHQGPPFTSAAVAVKDEAGNDALPNGSGVVRAPRAPYPPLAAEGGFRHFVYLQPSKNLQLMRDFDMMVVDAASELAAALANACLRESESAASPAAASGGSGDSSSSVPPHEEFYLVPCCLCGGGSSFSIGGFIRLRADNRVPPTDRVASDLLSQWQLQGSLQGAAASHTYADGTRAGPSGVPTPAYVLRVNWIEKYGRMPMLPARKQPLCGLFGGSRRGPLGASGVPVPGGSQGGGLLRRTTLGPSVEVIVDESKYEEVISCVRDYVQYGSRSSDPWRQGGPPGGAPASPGTHAGLGAPAGPAAAPDTHTSTARNSPPSSKAVEGGPQYAEVPPLSVASLLSLASAQVSTRRQQQQQQQQHGAVAAPVAGAGGPKPLALPGMPLNPSNPFLGYTAILPFLSEDQFSHVRRLQLKALKRAGIVSRGTGLEASTGSASRTSRRNSPHDSDGRSSCGEHEIQNTAEAAGRSASPAPEQQRVVRTHPARAPAAAPAEAAETAATPATAATAAAGAAPVAKPSGPPGPSPSASLQRRPFAVKRPAGAPTTGPRKAPVVPPPLKRLRAKVGQGDAEASPTQPSETLGSSMAPAKQQGAPSKKPGAPVSLASLSTNSLQSEGEGGTTAQGQLARTNALSPQANGGSAGETVHAGSSSTDSLAWSCAVEKLHSEPQDGAAITTVMQAAEAHQ